MSQTVSVPEIVGVVLTVTVTVSEQPLLFLYVMSVVPAETPVTTPILLTVAIAGVEDTHGFEAFAVPEPINVIVEPVHTVVVPVIVGNAFTVTAMVFDISEVGDTHKALLVIATEYTSPFTAPVVEYDVPVAAGVIATPFLRHT